MLTDSNVSQLTAWLGQGSVELTNIFTKNVGDDSAVFHAAVDGKGATISVMEWIETTTGASGIVGGYNPRSWKSWNNFYGEFNYSWNTDDRTAFLFNLSTDSIFHQNPANPDTYWDSIDSGFYQTLNALSQGPTFGLGHDLFVGGDLTHGFSYLYSYAATGGNNSTILGTNFGRVDTSDKNYAYVGKLEVFTISQKTVDVPEAPNIALFIIALFSLAVTRRIKL